ncbi:RNA-binding protein [Metabacillus herbersteinensis]|uniref:RNA-binding protein n=1 Tax=Metabacillus herbersteinensis TaxID=283816 RepID=A0ABV6GE37_9BACI
MNGIYQHFREEERHFIDQVLEWKEDVLTQYGPKLIDFLDPREQEIVQTIIGENTEVRVKFSGGAVDSERKRALFYPEYYVPAPPDYRLAGFEIQYASKFVTIEHREILGSLMAIGLKRAKFGDIRFHDQRIQLIVSEEISDYLTVNFNQVGRSKIALKRINLEQIITLKEELSEQTTTVASLRLDVILAAIYNISRQKVQPLISNGLVKVNWKTVEATSFECREGDTLSVRGFGRSKLVTIEGKTKKDKWRINVTKQK